MTIPLHNVRRLRLDTARFTLFVPGLGNVEAGTASAALAIRDYDPDLKLARHETTGEWVVFLERGLGGNPYPVFGLGNELPEAGEITRRLGAADVRRHGRRIVAEIDANNERKKAEAKAKADEGITEVAEHLEHVYRKVGGDRAVGQIFVPRSI